MDVKMVQDIVKLSDFLDLLLVIIAGHDLKYFLVVTVVCLSFETCWYTDKLLIQNIKIVLTLNCVLNL